MEYQIDSTSANELMPVQLRFFDYKCESNVSHWHPEVELFYVFEGTANVIVENEAFSVATDDVFLINSNDLHTITGHNCSMLSFQFNATKLPYFRADYEARFHLNSSGNTHGAKYDYIKYLLAQYVAVNESGEHIYKSLSIAFTLYSHLLENYQIPPQVMQTPSRKNRTRVLEIMKYMEDHYNEALTLSRVAEEFSYSGPYLSSFFEKNTGKNFLTLYNEIRLNHAVNALLTTDDSIESIATSNGFNDVRSFVALFKKNYNTVPSAYRKEYQAKTVVSNYSAPALTEDMVTLGANAVEHAIGYPSFMSYLTIYTENSSSIQPATNSLRIIDGNIISLKNDGVTLKHNYHKLTCVGSAKQFLYSEVQDMLRKAQQEIGFEYVKFHGLLSDDMMVYSEAADGSVHYSFTLIDKVFDFLLSINLRPLCQLSFMPIALASDPNRLVDYYHFNTSPPKDIDKWDDLIRAFTNHVIERYGLSEVRKWLFCVWNEPDETVEEFAFPDREQFFDFYCHTYNAVKGIDDKLQFGTPSLLLSITEEFGWARDFFIYIRDHHCPPDFLNIHYYDNTLFDSDERSRTRPEGFSAENMNTNFPLTTDPYAFMKFINNIKLLMKRYSMKSMPVYLTEWNLTISHRDLINDTCFKSCYLTKNLLENYDRLESFGYWSLTDFIEELQLPNELYHGGLGLFTYNGIPKAHYNVFKFFGHLKDEMIGKGDGYFVTRDGNRIAMIIYNYEHYSKLFASGTRTESDLSNRYASFSMSDIAQFSIRFEDIDSRYTSCLIRERFINQTNGSSYDAWIKMGAQPLTREEDLNILKEQSQPGMFLHQARIDNNELIFHTQLTPLEVRLVEIELTAN